MNQSTAHIVETQCHVPVIKHTKMSGEEKKDLCLSRPKPATRALNVDCKSISIFAEIHGASSRGDSNRLQIGEEDMAEHSPMHRSSCITLS